MTKTTGYNNQNGTSTITTSYSKNVFYTILILFIISLIPLYVIGFFAHPSVDDYYYGALTSKAFKETGSIGAVFKTSYNEMIRTYYDWQGNFSAIFLMRLQPAIFGERMYFITPIILITSYVLCSFFFFYTAFRWLAKASRYTSGIIALSITFVSMQLVAVPSDSFYWFNGAIYYTFFYSLMLLMYALMIRSMMGSKARFVYTILTFILAFFIGGSNFATALFTALMLALTAGACIYAFLILKKQEGNKTDELPPSKKRYTFNMLYTIILALSSMAGLFVSIAAPGNAIRQASVGGSTGIVKTFMYTFAYGGYSIATMLNAPTLIFIVCLIPVFYSLARRLNYTFKFPLLVLIFTFGLYCSSGTPVFYAQGLRIPYRMTNIIYFSSYSFVLFNVFYTCGYISKRYNNSAIITSLTSFFERIKENKKRLFITLLLCLFVFAIGCVGRITISEDENVTGKASFNNMPMTASAIYSLATGEARTYHNELLCRDAYLSSTPDLYVTVSPLSAKPSLIFHTDITDDPGNWRNAHLAMYYNKEIVWLE